MANPDENASLLGLKKQEQNPNIFKNSAIPIGSLPFRKPFL